MKFENMKPLIALALGLAASVVPARAGVIVVQNTSPGATSWPGAPVITTIGNPSSASVGESFTSGGGNTNLSQTFTVPSTLTLRAASIYVGSGGGSGTSPGAPVTLNLYDLGVQAATRVPTPRALSERICLARAQVCPSLT